jgi:hypothetical protein
MSDDDKRAGLADMVAAGCERDDGRRAGVRSKNPPEIRPLMSLPEGER